MKNLREELKKVVIEMIDTGLELGVRSEWRDFDIGDTVPNSYLWNYEEDHSTYEDEKPYELPGACATELQLNYYLSMVDTDNEDEVNEVIDKIIEAYEFSREHYDIWQDNKWYLIAGRRRAQHLANDDREIILADAIVVFKF